MAVEVLMRPTRNTYQLTFSQESVSVATSRLRMFTHLLPIVAGVALDTSGNRKVHYFITLTLADFSSVLRNVVSLTLAVFLII